MSVLSKNHVEESQRFDSIEDTIAAFKNGDFIIVLDSPQRENEGDLIISAAHFTPSKAAFMIRHTSGLLCAPLPSPLADRLDLPAMVADNRDPHRTAYTVSIDADDASVSTGISAHDRSLTCRLLADPAAQPHRFRRPGHVFPLRARDGGVRERKGHTEAAVEFCRLAGVGEVGVISELVDDGWQVQGRAERGEAGMMRRDACLRFARRWDLRICTIEALVEWLERRDGVGDGDGEGLVNGSA
ncbi:MAG: 3,4-dihydroxy 2-butanone 4-phosphate synthase [Peltula sp. TS41687]|nr:MAG: 3,4-dihydroxy 2-butanone 4-phosphate synthase [Peltula sp. TS41687]